MAHRKNRCATIMKIWALLFGFGKAKKRKPKMQRHQISINSGTAIFDHSQQLKCHVTFAGTLFLDLQSIILAQWFLHRFRIKMHGFC